MTSLNKLKQAILASTPLTKHGQITEISHAYGILTFTFTEGLSAEIAIHPTKYQITYDNFLTVDPLNLEGTIHELEMIANA